MRQARRKSCGALWLPRRSCWAVAPVEGVAQEKQRSRGSDIWAKPPPLAWRRGHLPASGAGASRLTWPLRRSRPRRAPLPALSVFVEGLVICTLPWSRFAGASRG
jgi:hypothetical protein